MMEVDAWEECLSRTCSPAASGAAASPLQVRGRRGSRQDQLLQNFSVRRNSSALRFFQVAYRGNLAIAQFCSSEFISLFFWQFQRNARSPGSLYGAGGSLSFSFYVSEWPVCWKGQPRAKMTYVAAILKVGIILGSHTVQDCTSAWRQDGNGLNISQAEFSAGALWTAKNKQAHRVLYSVWWPWAVVIM